jgi:hypothetical protein
VLLDPLMRSCLIEVHPIRFEDTLELSLMKDQQVVQAFLPHTPGRSARRWHWLVVHEPAFLGS